MSVATVSPAFIRFPPPPPTRNELSSEQRAKLIRTNNKLSQVLGSTPHVLDLSYTVPTTKIDLPPRPKTPTSSKNPFRKHSRTKSVDVDAARASAKSPDSVASRTSATSSRSTMRVKADELAWRSPYPMQRPPLLQLAVPSPARSRRPKLETIPGSPPFDRVAAPCDPPSFALPSEAAMRREKMRRVRKMLGDGVPTDLVFPSSPEESESESEEDSPVVSTPTSTMSREWLLVNTDKPLPSEPTPEPVPVLAARPKRPSPRRVQPKALEPEARPNRLFKERRKERPSQGASQLESIEESAKENTKEKERLTCVGVSASAGMSGMGKSRRFVRGEIAMDQIGAVWGGVGW